MQKLLLIIIVSCLSLATSAQWRDEDLLPHKERPEKSSSEALGFKLINGGIIWQYVYETDKSKDEIVKSFKDSKLFQIEDMDSVTINGAVNNKPIEYRKYKFSSGSIPMFIPNSNCSYIVKIDVKDNRYRVTISQVIFNLTINLTMKYISSNSNRLMSLNEIAYNFKRNIFRPSFSSNEGDKVLATVWYNTYQLSGIEPVTDNW